MAENMKTYLERQYENYDKEVVKPLVKSAIKGIDGIAEVPSMSVLDLEYTHQYLNNLNYRWFDSQYSNAITLPVEVGEVYRITATYKDRSAIYGFFDGNGNKIEIYPDGTLNSSTRETVTVTVPTGATELRASSFASQLIIEKQTSGGTYKVIDKSSNVLYGKKWAVCGDSFTAGEFVGYVDSNGKTGTESDAFDKVQNRYKTYPWWIGNRNNMNIQWLAQSGNAFTNTGSTTRPFSNSESSVNYTLVATDCDYITLAFGLNEASLTAEQIGTNTDSDNTTLWGAYNVVLDAILTANPTVKIGIIINDAWMSQTYHDALIEIAKYWGIPYLDLKNGIEVPMMIGGRLDATSLRAKAIRDGAFRISSESEHPNVEGHKYRSTIIENFLRSL